MVIRDSGLLFWATLFTPHVAEECNLRCSADEAVPTSLFLLNSYGIISPVRQHKHTRV